MENNNQRESASAPGERLYSTQRWIVLYLYVAGIDFLLKLTSSIFFVFTIRCENAFLAKIIARASFLSNWLYVACSIILSIWIYQTSRNARLSGATGTFSPMNACSWWIFPVLISQTIPLIYSLLIYNYFSSPFGQEMPAIFSVITIVSVIIQSLVLQELWKTSIHPLNWKKEPESPQITCWLVLNLLFIISFIFICLNPILFAWREGIGCGIYLAIVLLMASIMRTISSRQDAIRKKLSDDNESILD